MADLRQKQKQKREEAIINAAKELIAEKGYRNTSIEEIAERAEVGPATVYNYFTSKSNLFVTVFRQEVEILLEIGAEIVANPPADPEEAVSSLMGAYFGGFMDRYNKQLMREIFIAALVEQLSVRQELIGLDYALMAQLTGLLNVIKDRGDINISITVEDLAFIIYSVTMTDLMMYFADEDMTSSDCLSLMKHHISLALQGFSPKQ